MLHNLTRMTLLLEGGEVALSLPLSPDAALPNPVPESGERNGRTDGRRENEGGKERVWGGGGDERVSE